MNEIMFLTTQHRIRYEALLHKDSTRTGDVERKVLFYLISGNSDLYRKSDKIYDFPNHLIRLCLTEEYVDFSTGCKSLVRLGFNLYNGYKDEATSPNMLFNHLDHENRVLALNAMVLRFGTG